ncbi:hypothetical protein B0H13DRAFT_2275004 [Mycena leptocephala]|nr:hypothetical protein B0H13DRAFT_2275004 [Mycena leptocephala]
MKWVTSSISIGYRAVMEVCGVESFPLLEKMICSCTPLIHPHSRSSYAFSLSPPLSPSRFPAQNLSAPQSISPDSDSYNRTHLRAPRIVQIHGRYAGSQELGPLNDAKWCARTEKARRVNQVNRRTRNDEPPAARTSPPTQSTIGTRTARTWTPRWREAVRARGEGKAGESSHPHSDDPPSQRAPPHPHPYDRYACSEALRADSFTRSEAHGEGKTSEGGSTIARVATSRPRRLGEDDGGDRYTGNEEGGRGLLNHAKLGARRGGYGQSSHPQRRAPPAKTMAGGDEKGTGDTRAARRVAADSSMVRREVRWCEGAGVRRGETKTAKGGRPSAQPQDEGTKGIAMGHPTPCASSRDRKVLGVDGDDEIGGDVCVRLPMPRHGGWLARAGAQARSTMQLVTESCDSEACSCIDGPSTNDAFRADEGYVAGAEEALFAGWSHDALQDLASAAWLRLATRPSVAFAADYLVPVASQLADPVSGESGTRTARGVWTQPVKRVLPTRASKAGLGVHRWGGRLDFAGKIYRG